jgi:hypothetical protein
MSFWELLDELQAHDVRVGLYLDVDMPADTPGALVEALREYKPILLLKLAREAQWDVLSKQRWGVDDHFPGIDRFPPRRLSGAPERPTASLPTQSGQLSHVSVPAEPASS